MQQFSLEDARFAGRTGRGVRVAIIDSGVHAGNPHISSVCRAVHISANGVDDDAADRLGHGTAVAAAILEKAPGIELNVIRVFDNTLATSAAVLAAAIEWAIHHHCQLINLSLGTPNPDHAELLRAAVTGQGIVVSAAEWYPGCLPGVIGVQSDWDCPRDELRLAGDFFAAPYPRPIEGVPAERNLRGISFAVANTTGFLARLLEDRPEVMGRTELEALL